MNHTRLCQWADVRRQHHNRIAIFFVEDRHEDRTISRGVKQRQVDRPESLGHRLFALLWLLGAKEISGEGTRISVLAPVLIDAEDIRAIFKGDEVKQNTTGVPMRQFELDEVRAMSFEQLGAIEDPVDLMATGSVAPILVRYTVRTGQLERRYPGIALPTLLDAIMKSATMIDWPLATVAQKAPQAKQDADVDAYLDELQPHLERALKPH